MADVSEFPGQRTSWILVVLLILLSFGAVTVGGVVWPERLAWLAAAEESYGWRAADWWALLIWGWRSPFAPFVAAIVWGGLGVVAAFLAVRRWLGPLFATALVGAATLAGWPGWDAALPTAGGFYLLPAALALWLCAALGRRRLAGLRVRVAAVAARKRLKAAWAILMVFAVFTAAERFRVGARGAANGKFPYGEAGLPRGFDPELKELRLVHHAGFFLAAVWAINDPGLLHDNRLVALLAHGAPARFVTRVGLARPDRTPPRLIPPITSAGWRLTGTPLGWRALPGVTGLRYQRLRVELDGAPAGDWAAARERVWRERPLEARIVGSLYPGAVGKHLWIEVETRQAEGVTAAASVEGESVSLVRRELPAGDRVIVRFAAPLPELSSRRPPLAVGVSAPGGMLDLDLFLHSPVPPAEETPIRREARPFTFEGI